MTSPGADQAAPAAQQGEVGVGPWPGPWPADDRYDPALLANGDRRNVVDRYRYWRLEAIVAELDTHRRPLHVAIENWQHDFNIGSIVRTANAFNVAGVHVIGNKRWNRRGAMVTDRYVHIHHHHDAAALATWAAGADVAIIGIDNVPGSRPLESYPLPERCVLVFGQESAGLSAEAQAVCRAVLDIAQDGSTRSLNAGAAAAIAMHAWAALHVPPRPQQGPDGTQPPEAGEWPTGGSPQRGPDGT